VAAKTSKNTIGLLLSGGLDSAILLGHLLGQDRPVQPFYVRSHLTWEEAELAAARRFLAALARPALAGLIVLEMPLADVYEQHWSVTGRAVPDAASPDTAVYLPGRNALLAIKPMVWCCLHGIEELALAVLGSDSFHDASDDFFERFQSAMARAMDGGVRLVRPLARLEKRQGMELGRGLPLELTFSCIAPVDGRHCGRCNKCAERMAAFRAAAVRDPTAYAECSNVSMFDVQ
jgi:7-cyano-7-deazaguanine synthase